MRSSFKIVSGASALTAGIFLTITSIQQLIEIASVIVGPLLVFVGAFIVWLESDSWKTESYTEVQTAEDETNKPDYDQILDGTVNEVRHEVMQRQDDLNLKRLLERERAQKDRKTLKNFLERRIQD